MTSQTLRDESNTPALADEGRFLGANLFGATDINAGVLANYVNAVTVIVLSGKTTANSHATGAETRGHSLWRRVVDRALAERLDVQGLELVLRRKWPQNPLSQRAHILAFLLETDAVTPSYQRFINIHRSRVAAYLTLLWYAASTFGHYLRGLLLLKRLERRVTPHV